jgi:hypothetical protein
MKSVMMLEVHWSDRESAVYYVDKDKYSKAHFRAGANQITLDSWSGTYFFLLDFNQVLLVTGPESHYVEVKSFRVYNTPVA